MAACTFDLGLKALPYPPEFVELYRQIATGSFDDQACLSFLVLLHTTSVGWVNSQILKGRPLPPDFYSTDQSCRYFGVDPRTDRHGLGLHWTATAELRRSCADLLSANDKKSSNQVIGYDGSLVELYPVDCVTWHGCENKWRLGVDFVHPGWLVRNGRGGWEDWAGRPYDTKLLPDAIELPDTAIPAGWRNLPEWAGYTVQQLRSLIVLGRALLNTLTWEIGWEFLKGHYQTDRQKADPWHFPLRHLEESIMGHRSGCLDDVSDQDWWAVEYATNPRAFITSNRLAGTL